MEVPLEITFRGVDKTADVEDLIRAKVDKLEQICDHMVSCRVAVESPHEHQQSGSPFRVRINMRVPPGHDLVVKRESTEGYLHETLPVVLTGAFDAAFRQLKKLVDKQQGQVKTPAQQDNAAVVIRLNAGEGYGFIKTREGRELYFHRNSVLNDDFDRLVVGSGVRFAAAEGEQGPHASTVQITDKP